MVANSQPNTRILCSLKNLIDIASQVFVFALVDDGSGEASVHLQGEIFLHGKDFHMMVLAICHNFVAVEKNLHHSPLLSAQLPRSVSMLIKSFKVFYYVFLVVPSLDFVLEVK